jgi:hypothetical protein
MPDGNLDPLAEAFSAYIPKAEGEPNTPTPEPEGEAPETEAPAPEADEAVTETQEEGTDEEAEGAEEDVADESDEETETHTIKVNGEEIAVTLAELKAGYQKDADYRQKTAELATIRKDVEADKSRFDNGIKTLVQQLAVAENLIRESTLELTDDQLDKLAVENPAEYVRMKRLLEKSEQKRALLSQQYAESQAVAEREYKARVEKQRQQELAELGKELPEFRKPETMERLTQYLKGEAFAFTDEVLNSVTDRRFIKLAEKARRYDALIAKGRDKQEKVAPKVIKPTAAKPVQENDAAKDFQRNLSLAKKGDKNAAAALMAHL